MIVTGPYHARDKPGMKMFYHHARANAGNVIRVPHGTCHAHDSLMKSPYARDDITGSSSFVFPLLILVRCNDMLYMYKNTSIMMRNAK